MTTTLLLVVAAVIVWGIWTYNGFVQLKQRSHQAFADIDAQLKRRYDLVPALVATVKGYAGHEKATLEEVVKRRGQASGVADGESAAPQRIVAENFLSHALRGVFALAEAYPDLKASDRFGGLQTELAAIEDDLQSARRYYNAVVRDLNTKIQKFPDMLIAGAFSVRPRDFFELDSPLERETVSVDLSP